MAEPSTHARRPSATAREIKLVILAVLAGVYLALWPQLTRPAAQPAGHRPPPTRGIEARAEARSATVAGTVWWDTLPVDERPALGLPEGWRLASTDGSPRVDPGPLDTTTATADAPARPVSRRASVRVAATRRDRVRTRSS